MNPIVPVMYVIGKLIRQIRNSTLELDLTYQLKILRGKHKETSNKYLPVNSNLFVLYYFCLVLVFEARILRALWTMISEDKENMWTSNLIKKSNNDNSAVVVAFASHDNIKQYQTQFKYKISVLHSLLWVSNTQKFIHYKKFWKLKSSISERISVCLKEVLFIAPSMLFLWKKKANECYQCSPFYKRATVPSSKSTYLHGYFQLYHMILQTYPGSFILFSF